MFPNPAFMQRAVELARNSFYISKPNPRVGCVIVRDGRILSEGWTQRAGGDHAEIHALKALPEDARGADVYVTLEPCSHYGRTPPCVDALIKSGVSRVAIAAADPNPLVNGSGVSQLQAAGIETHVGLCESEARRLNRGFYRRIQGGLPWVTLKIASTLDGRTATHTGESQWITGEAARQDVHRLRASSCAVVTGIGTVLADNPRLNVRLESEDVVQPLRVVLDSEGRLPDGADIIGDDDRFLHVVSRRCRSSEAKALIVGERQIDLKSLLEHLAMRECNEVMVECGARLAGSFVEQKLVDELVLYQAPMLIGNTGLGTVEFNQPYALSDCPRMSISAVHNLGSDLRITAILDN